jgi:L-galactose dehydrogenase
MDYRILGKTGLKVSVLGFGASALGGVFHGVDENEGIRAVHAALDCGITYFDVAPAYGGTRSETILGRALRGIPRHQYLLSTKVGKYTAPGEYGGDTLDYSRDRIRTSLKESSARLGTDYFDIVHLHDIEYLGRRHTEWALDEGLNSLMELRREGRIGAVGMGIYPLDLWRRILTDYDIDAGLVHNHYCLNDTSLLELLPLARPRAIGIINGSPFASGLLTDRGPASWHPAGPEDRAVFRQAAEYCRREGSSIGKLALQFSSRHPGIPTTLFSASDPETVRGNVQSREEPFDEALALRVQEVLRPVMNKQWSY